MGAHVFVGAHVYFVSRCTAVSRCHGAGNPPGTFTARLGLPPHADNYTFLKLTPSSRSGQYASLMIQECQKYGMKPVCDHPDYCMNDPKSVYLGQARHIANPPDRNRSSWFPSGWSSISSNWNGLCSYTKDIMGDSSLCNVPINTHAWRSPSQYNPGFICGRCETCVEHIVHWNNTDVFIATGKLGFEITIGGSRTPAFDFRYRSSASDSVSSVKGVTEITGTTEHMIMLIFAW